MTKPLNAKAYKRALKSIEKSRLAVQALIDATPINDNYALGLLGPILSELRYAQATIEQVAQQHTA